MDYDIYAEGEAVLGWLNTTLALTAQSTVSWDDYAQQLLQALGQCFDRRNAAVGHFKLIISTEAGQTTGNITGKADTLSVKAGAGKGSAAQMTLNARVEMSPQELEEIVNAEIACLGESLGVSSKIVAGKSLQPGRPEPTFRYQKPIV